MGNVHTAVFSPDGTRIVTAGEDKTARIWDTATGKQILVLRGHNSGLKSAFFSPDGTRIITTAGDVDRDVTGDSDYTARLWDADTGTELAVLRGHADVVFNAAFSPGGHRIATASRDHTARIWDVASESYVILGPGSFPEGDPRIAQRIGRPILRRAAFSPDGTRIVTADDLARARVWNLATGKESAVLYGHQLALTDAEFSPDGSRIVTASLDGTARVWDVASGRQVAVLQGHADFVNRANFSPDGARVVTASSDGTARVWDATTGSQIAVLRGHDGSVGAAAFSPDGNLILTASTSSLDTIFAGKRSDGTARIWDAATGRQLRVLAGPKAGLTDAVFSPDGKHVLASSYDQTARTLGRRLR